MSRAVAHHIDCRCDACVVEIADKRLVVGIVSRLALHGCIDDSAIAERRAAVAVARALLELGAR